ncbi:MAG: hypothetical protein K9G33_17105 [Sneathiella sp.]|nr:hypothetical protein [Sneathiella sp.]
MTKGRRDKLDQEEYDAVYDRGRQRWHRNAVRRLKSQINRRVRHLLKRQDRTDTGFD